MTTPPKYEDLVLKVAELERREAALLEELATLRESYESMRDRKNSIVYLQQRLTVAEKRASDLLIMLRMAWGSDDVSAEDCRRIDAELKPAAECGHGYSNLTGCPVCQGIKP